MQIYSNMRIKTLILTVFLSLLSVNLYAGENDWYMLFSPSCFVNPLQRHSLQGVQLGFEKELSGRNITGFSVFGRSKQLYRKADFKDAEYSLVGYYKPSVATGKNSNLYVSVGGNVGSGSKGVTFGLNLGFEYNLTLPNRMKVFVSQDNLLVFRSDDRLISGLSIGVKIPLSL